MRRPKIQQPHIEGLALLGLAIACYVLFFHRLGDMGLIGPDEPRYAAIARNMYLTGDYITPRLQGAPWMEKPPLLYWGAALAYAIFGVGEWSARFPSAFGATLSVFAVYGIGRLLWSRTTAVFAAMAMASSAGYFVFARAASMDMPLTACLTIALGCFLAGYQAEEPRRRWWFYGFYAMLGLGALAKGPIAFALPAFSIALFLTFGKRWREWKSFHLEGLVIGLAVALPWYAACTWVNGRAFIDEFFLNHNLMRFTTNLYGHRRPFYFYLPVLLFVTFPWAFLLIPVFSRRWNTVEHILAWWWIAPLGLFSLSASKLPGYILPAVPGVVLMCAQEFRRPSTRTFKIAAWFEAGTLAFIGVAFGFYGDMLRIDAHLDGMIIFGIAFAMAAMIAVTAVWLKPAVLAGINLMSMVLLTFAAATFVVPRFDRTETMRPWEHALDGMAAATTPVCLYRPDRWMEYGMLFYRPTGTESLYAPEELTALVKSQTSVLCITEDKYIKEVSELPNLEIKIVQTTIGEQKTGTQTAFIARASR